MQAQYKTYDSYKDSGVPWLGKIPDEWQTQKSKFLWKELELRSDKGEENLLSVSQYEGVVPRADESRSDDLTGYKSAEPEDLVINIMLAWMGGLGVSKYSGIVSPAYAVYRQTTPQNSKYLDYLYRTPVYLAEFARRSKGVVPSRWRMYTQDFGQVLTLLPSRKEQDRIVEFLDQKTAEIDAALEKKQRLIELLKEQKSILINQAVTKGLNPSAPMKDSGIEWIGQIPAHWEVKKLKSEFTFEKGINAQLFTHEYIGKHEGAYPVFSGQTENNGVMGCIDSYAYELEACIFVTTVGAKAMTPKVLRGKFSLSQNCLIMHPTSSSVDVDFFYFQLWPLFAYEKKSISSHMQDSLRVGDIKNFSGILPPMDEQIKIRKYLCDAENETDTNIALAHSVIEKLQEFKQTLIAHAVTGKIKV